MFITLHTCPLAAYLVARLCIISKYSDLIFAVLFFSGQRIQIFLQNGSQLGLQREEGKFMLFSFYDLLVPLLRTSVIITIYWCVLSVQSGTPSTHAFAAS